MPTVIVGIDQIDMPINPLISHARGNDKATVADAQQIFCIHQTTDIADTCVSGTGIRRLRSDAMRRQEQTNAEGG